MMDSYDSDSSAGEDAPYTETSILLGYSSKEPTDDSISHLGAHPVYNSRLKGIEAYADDSRHG
jgi:pre-rRNA-processing protein TSR4